MNHFRVDMNQLHQYERCVGLGQIGVPNWVSFHAHQHLAATKATGSERETMQGRAIGPGNGPCRRSLLLWDAASV